MKFIRPKIWKFTLAIVISFLTFFQFTTTDLCWHKNPEPNCALYNYTIPQIIFFIGLAYVLYSVIYGITKLVLRLKGRSD